MRMCFSTSKLVPSVHGVDDEFHVDLFRAAQFANRTFSCVSLSSAGLLEELQEDLPGTVNRAACSRAGIGPLFPKLFKISFCGA